MNAAKLIEAARLEHRCREIMQGTVCEQTAVSAEDLAVRMINCISNPLYRALLLCRGIYAEKWGQLPGKLHYSERQLRRIYHAALAQLQYVLDRDPNM